MTEQILAPIELNDDELLAVSGGVAVGIAQVISQERRCRAARRVRQHRRWQRRHIVFR